MKILPHAKDAEQAIIWAMIIDDSIINSTELVKEDFYDIDLWKIFWLMKAVKDAGKKIDLVILKEYLEAKWVLERIWGITFLVELTEYSNSNNWTEYEQTIKDKSNRRKIIEYAMKMESMARDEGIDAKDSIKWIEWVSDVLFKENKWNTIIDLVDDFEEIREAYNRQGALWYKWPFEHIDKYTQWIIPGMVYMICAYSNVWKSALSYAYVCDLLKKWKKVIFFSLEVTRWVLMTNLVRCMYWKSYHEIMNPDFYYEMADFENLLVYDDKHKLEDIKNITKSQNPDVIFIDFVQNIEWLWMSEYENMTRCAKEIQSMAIKTNTTVFSISQVSNESRFKLDTMQPKGSWQLFFSSDVIIGMYKDWWCMYGHLIKNKFWQNDKKFLINPDFARLNFKIVEELWQSQDENLAPKL